MRLSRPARVDGVAVSRRKRVLITWAGKEEEEPGWAVEARVEKPEAGRDSGVSPWRLGGKGRRCGGLGKWSYPRAVYMRI